MAETLGKSTQNQRSCQEDFPGLGIKARNYAPGEKPSKEFKKDFKTLRNILHARVCYKYCYTNCMYPKCGEFKNMLLHLSHCCLSSKECTHYKNESRMISHWLWCEKADCEICMPFKGVNRKVLECNDLKVSFRRRSTKLDCTAKALFFDHMKSEVTVVVSLSEVDSSSLVEIEIEFMFNGFPWVISLCNTKKKDKKAEDKKKYLDILLYCNRDSKLPFWRLDCICEIRFPTIPLVERYQQRFNQRNNNLFDCSFLTWMLLCTTAVKDSFEVEICLSTVTFREVCRTTPPPCDYENDHNVKIFKKRMEEKVQLYDLLL